MGGTGSAATFSDLLDGAHVLLLKARDRAGNVSPSPVQVNFTVDTTPPSNCSIHSFNGDLTAGWVSRFTPPAGNSSVVSVSVAGSAADAGGPFAGVAYRWRPKNGGAAAAGSEGWKRMDDGSGLAAFSLPNLTDGEYELSAFGEDHVGNRSPEPCANVTWRVDLTPPVSTVFVLHVCFIFILIYFGTSFVIDVLYVDLCFHIASCLCILHCNRDFVLYVRPSADNSCTAFLCDCCGHYKVVVVLSPSSGVRTKASSLSLQLSFSEPLLELRVRFPGQQDYTSLPPAVPELVLSSGGDGAFTAHLLAVDSAGNAQRSATAFSWVNDTSK